jgi:Flp pilus assembly protein TadG
MSKTNGKSLSTAKKPIWKRFLKDQSGSVLQILGLSAVPLFLATGAAVDMMRATREQAAFYGSVDAAALAIAGDDKSATVGVDTATLATNKVYLEDLAKKYILADYRGDTGSPPSISTNVTVTGQSVVLKSSLTFPTTIMSLAGIQSMTINASSTIKKAIRPIELTMVMDTTGSMANDNKMSGAKSAAHTLLEKVYGGTLAAKANSEFLRVSLVPFAAGVRLDQNAFDFDMNWIDTSGSNPLSRVNIDAAAPASWNNFTAWGKMKVDSSTSLAWNGCVEARARGTAGSTDYIVNDVAPQQSNTATLFPAYFAPDTPLKPYTDSRGRTKYQSMGPDYISEDGGSPDEVSGLSPTEKASWDDVEMVKRQENWRKYDGRLVGSEAAPLDSQGEGPWSNCAASKVVPMTYDRAKIETGIDSMAPNGNTLIAEGLSWGWRTISPGAPFTKVQGSGSIPASVVSPYGDPRWQKVMILMTDGDNNVSENSKYWNNSAYSAYGFIGEPGMQRFNSTNGNSAADELDTNMLTVCQKIKDQNIELYVTSFGSSGISNTSKTRLQTCATTPDHYTHATTTADLVTFFDHVGANVLNKMIYVSK